MQYSKNIIERIKISISYQQLVEHRKMSFIKQHPTISPVLKLHILNLEAKENIFKNENNALSLQKIQYLTKTRMFDKLLKEVENIKDLQFPTLKEKLTAAKEKTLEEKKALGEENIRKTLEDLYRRTSNDEDSEEIDAGQLAVYKLAKIYFDEGAFDKSTDLLLQLQKQGLKDHLWIRVPYARLYNQILRGRDEAKRTIDIVRKRFQQLQNDQYKAVSKNKQQTAKLVKNNYSQKEQLLALSTVVYFTKTKDEDLEKYVDFCNDKACFSVIQLLSPHLLRYLTVAAIVNKNLHKNRSYSFDLYKLTEIIKRGVVKYSDPFTEFIENLYLNFDFDSATENIKQINEIISKDVLLLPLRDRIIESCQFLYFKVYCKIYESLKISEISAFTKKSEMQAELWILKYIRSSDIEAKIDSIEGKVISMRNKENRAERYINAIPNINTLISTMTTTSHSQHQE